MVRQQKRLAWPRELTAWGLIALLCVLLLVFIIVFVALVGGDFTPPWLLVLVVVLGVPLLIGLLVELITTIANQVRLSRLRALARAQLAHEQWIIVEDWWDTESLLRLNAIPTGRPVLHLFALLTEVGLEIWHRNNRLTTLEWNRIHGVRVGSRKRLTGIDKLQQGEEILRTWGKQTRDDQWQSVRRESGTGSKSEPVLELTVAGIEQPIAFSVTGRNPLGPQRAALRRVTQKVDTIERLLETR